MPLNIARNNYMFLFYMASTYVCILCSRVSTVRYGTVRYGTVRYSTVQYRTGQYSRLG